RYVDPGYTGKDGNRPGLKRLQDDAKYSMFEKVVVFRLDRLARKLRLILEIEEKLKEHGIGLHSVKDTIDTSTTMGRTVFQVLGLAAEWEREAIVDRTKNGRLQRYKDGCWAGGKPPYGYSYDKDSKKLVIDKKEAMVIRRIFTEYNSGKSLAGIANALNGDRIPPRWSKGKGWRPNAIRHIVLNPVYKGTQILNRHQHISDIARVDMSKAIIVDVPHIISEEEWQLAQEHLVANKRVRPVRENKWLLQGMITCGLCGMSFKAEGSPRYRYYSCRGRLKQHRLDGSPRCTSPRHNADWLEEQVWQRVEAIVNDPNNLNPLLRETIDSLRNREEELRARILPIDEQLVQIAEQKMKLADDWVVSNMNAERFHELRQSLEKEETRLTSIRAEIDPAQIQELESTRGLLRFWQGQMESMAWNTEEEDGRMVRLVDTPHKTVLRLAGLESASLSESMQFPATRRELLQKLQVQVVVFHDRIDVKAIFPIEPVYHQKCTSTY
ncbi:MAG: recombinase family protein, partial [Dehalococcoidales bacterium]|nr:recombinase family protein [Dehalococcoidales bacterium]